MGSVALIEGSFVRRLALHVDHRGSFLEAFNASCFEDPELRRCLQVSVSRSRLDVLRGIHASPYGKLVSCVQGRVLDYCVDLRPESPTYLRWQRVELDARSPEQVYVPERCGHLVLSLEDDSLLCYAQSGSYDRELEMEVHARDEQIGLAFPKPVREAEYVMSEKDSLAPSLREAREAYRRRVGREW
ncbi:dTDP-4-dehydrorhamnose 3,5-epimerase-like [Schistocerca gregaria]|uniref:dTDP-4-dehydrorhamnose 3,5-epimerase-like n=1 Tax=Schistocerca gregaria TaxID=7010 RepID=UPI00211E6DC4|nr:dTDP-4-dehydrorhamnose 3,5-epimerase-like [Schistocerca gregaria]